MYYIYNFALAFISSFYLLSLLTFVQFDLTTFRHAGLLNFQIMKTLLLITALWLIASCQSETEPRGGIIFTFDDQFIDTWLAHQDLFEEYDIKATFFITRPHQLDSSDIRKLRLLNEAGHEIACHGLNHKNPVNYVDSPAVYLQKEIIPAIEILEELGFAMHSFAYPFGRSFPELDSLLLNHIDYIRKATWNKKDTTINYYDQIYMSDPKDRITNSMGIDHNYNISPENFEQGVIRARENNEVLVLHAHKINTSEEDYTIHPEMLETYFQISKKHGLASIRLNDIKNWPEALNPN